MSALLGGRSSLYVPLLGLNETYQLASKLFGTEIMNEIAGV